MTNRLNRLNLEQRDLQNPLNHGDALIRPRQPWDDTLDEITNLLRILHQDLEQGAGDLSRGQHRASLNNLAASPEPREAVEIPVHPQNDNEIQDDNRFLDDNEIQDDNETQDDNEIQDDNNSLDDIAIQDGNGSHNRAEEDECSCELCEPGAASFRLPPCFGLSYSYQPCPCGNCMIGQYLVFSQTLYDRTPTYLFNFPQEQTTMTTARSSDTDAPRERKSKIGLFFRNVFSKLKRNTESSFSPAPALTPFRRTWWRRVFRRLQP